MEENEKTDKELVKKILEGNTQIFEIVIAKTQGLVLSIIYKMIKDEEDQKDLAQEVYLKAFNKLGSFNFKAKLSTWIATITYNTCLNHLSKKKLPMLNLSENKDKASIENQFFLNTEIQTEDPLIKQERIKIVTAEIEKLPPLFKTIITLFHQQELSYKEIAMITGLPEGTLKSYLYRARKQLKNNLLTIYKKEDL